MRAGYINHSQYPLRQRLTAGFSAIALAMQPPLVYALPEGGVVSGGSADISASGNALQETATMDHGLVLSFSFKI